MERTPAAGSYMSKRKRESLLTTPTPTRTRRYTPLVFAVASFDDSEQQQQQQQQESDQVTETTMLTRGLTVSDSDVLDCPICTFPLTIHVYQCNDGHFLCQTCYEKIEDKCPTCTKPIGNKRCKGMEMVLESIKTSCQNLDYGCMEKISYCNKLDHEKNSCKFATTPCPHSGCDYVGVVKGFYDHYAEKHPDSCKLIRFNSVTSVNVVDEEPYLLFEKKKNILFFLSRVIDPLGSFVCVSTAYNMKFSYDVRAGSGDLSVSMKSFVDIAPKCFEKPDKEKCLLVTRNIHKEDSMLPLAIAIRKVSV